MEYNFLSRHILPNQYVQIYRAVESPSSPEYYGESSQRQLYLGQDTQFLQEAVGGTVQYAAIADALTTTGALWFVALNNVTAKFGHGASLADQSDAIHTIRGQNYQPFVTTYCAEDVINGTQDMKPLALPLLQSANNMSIANTNLEKSGEAIPATVLSNISRKDILNLPGALTEHVLHWVSLKEVGLNGSTIGAVVRLPRKFNDSTTGIVLCNIASGWGTTSLQFHTQAGGTGIVSSEIRGGLEPSKLPIDSSAADPAGEDKSKEFVFDYPKYPQKPIQMTTEWANFLNPYVEAQNSTVFELIMQQEFLPDIYPTPFEVALTAMVTNGLGNIGYGRTLQGSIKSITGRDGSTAIDGNFWVSGQGDVFQVNDPESANWVKLRVTSFLEGYAYNTRSVPPIVAIVILMMYCVLALGHMFYSGIKGKLPLRDSLSKSRLTLHLYRFIFEPSNLFY